MAVITISREFGSGGDQVAERLCELLGYQAFGKDLIAAVAEETNMSKLNIVDYSEDNHEVQNFLDRLFRRTASPVQHIAWSEDPSIATRPERADVQEAAVISLVKRAIKAAYKRGNMVIVGRGGQALLKDMPGVLHVRIISPLENRIQRVSARMTADTPGGPGGGDWRLKASELIANRDKASADYIHRYYNIDWAEPRLYHMVLNLGPFTEEQAAQVIAAAVKEMEITR